MSTKILLGFLIVTLIAPTVFFVRPQKAEALVSLAMCFTAKGTAAGIAGAAAGTAAIVSVSVSDIANTVTTAQGTAGTDWTSCFIKGLTRIIAKTLLHTFTQSIVKWINTGFQGSPSFITNPEGFFNDVADQTVGQVIGAISPLLCAPFRLDIRLNLGLNLSLNTEDEFRCRLSDVIANVRGAYDGFVTGAVGSGNLSQWIHIAGTPQNNPYGAYIATTNKLGISIVSATGQQTKLLDWGKGFRSWRSCEAWGPKVKDASGRVIRNGPCIKEGPIKTPGSIIQDQTSGALGTTFRELELANEIDEIIGALINQLLVKAITGAGGLLGASKGDSSNGEVSAFGALVTDRDAVLAGSNAQPPSGINCRLRYYPATVESPAGSGIYVPNRGTGAVANQVWTDNLNLGKPNEDPRPIIEAGASKNDSETWAQYFARVRTGCRNEVNAFITGAAETGLQKYGSAGSGTAGSDTSMPPTPPTPAPPPVNVSREISLASATLNQSYIYTGPNEVTYGPANALYGSSRSSTHGSPTNQHWWTASLKREEKIAIIKIRSYPGYPLDSIRLAILPPEKMDIPVTLDDVRDAKKIDGGSAVTYSYDSKGNKSTPPGVVVKNESEITITLDTPVSANALAIFNETSAQALTSVKLYRPYEAPVTTSTAPPEIPFAFTASPAQVLLTSPKVAEPFPVFPALWIPTFVANQPKGGINFRARLFTCPSPTPATPAISCNDTDRPYEQSPGDFLTTGFSSLNIKYTVGNLTTVKNAINVDAGGALFYNASTDLALNNTVQADTSSPASGVTFLTNLSVVSGSSISISVTGTLRSRIPFRIVIEAVENAGLGAEVILGSVKADFDTQ